MQLAVVALSVVALWSAVIAIVIHTWPRGREIADSLALKDGQEFHLVAVAGFDWDKVCLENGFTWARPLLFSEDEKLREYVFLKGTEAVRVVEASRFGVYTDEEAGFSYPCFDRTVKARVDCGDGPERHCVITLIGTPVARPGGLK